MELKNQVESLQRDIVQLTAIMTEKAQKDLTGEVKELSDKLAGVMAELNEKKIQFQAQSGSRTEVNKKELETRMDELFIAKHLCVNKETGLFDAKSWEKVITTDIYADAIKAFGDVDASTTTTADNFIPVGFSSQLMEEIFLNLQLAGLYGRINMPNATFKLPFAPGRLIAKRTLEGGSPTKSKPGDAQITFTAQKLMSIVEFTDELDQDAIVAILNLCRKQLIGGFALAQDTVALNGDKTPTIYTTTALDASDCRLIASGIRADALATGTKYDCSTGKCNVTNIRKMRALMGKFGVSPSKMAILCSIADYNNLLQDTAATAGGAYQTLDTYGSNAVILKGELGRVDNIPIVITELMPNKALVDSPDVPGGVLATGITNLTAAGVCGASSLSTFAITNTDAFLWGDRKEFGLELWRNPLNQTTNLIGSQRLDFQKVTGAGSTPNAIGINYAN